MHSHSISDDHSISDEHSQDKAVVPSKTEKMWKKQKELSPDVWLRRMTRFIKLHTEQMKRYSDYEMDMVIARYERCMTHRGFPYLIGNPTDKELHVLQTIFDISAFSPDAIFLAFTDLAAFYAEKGRMKEFESIALNMSVIINSAMMF